MASRWSVLALILGMVGGYAVGSRPVEAQGGSGFPVANGERLNFINEDGRIMGVCTVSAIHGDYIGCGQRANEVQEWWRMDRVAQIQKIPSR